MAFKSLKETFEQGTDTLQNVPTQASDAEDEGSLASRSVFRAGQDLDWAVRQLDKARGPVDKDNAYKTVEKAQDNYDKIRTDKSKLKPTDESLIKEDLSQHDAFRQAKKLKGSFGSKSSGLASKAHEIHKRNDAVAKSHAKAMEHLESQGKKGTPLHDYHSAKFHRHSELADKFGAFSQGLKS